jgi:histidine triad (HIT) family protein
VSECLFCMIVGGKIPSKKVYEDEEVLAIYDVAPAAPVHILVMPKKHIASLADVTDQELALIGRLHGVIRDLAVKLGLKEGYRVVNNCGEEGGQSVPHLHFHLLGGRKLSWPPG